MMDRRTFIASLGLFGACSEIPANAERVRVPETVDTVGEVERIKIQYVLDPGARNHILRVDALRYLHSFRAYLLRCYYVASLRGELPWISTLGRMSTQDSDAADRGVIFHKLNLYVEWPSKIVCSTNETGIAMVSGAQMSALPLGVHWYGLGLLTMLRFLSPFGDFGSYTLRSMADAVNQDAYDRLELSQYPHCKVGAALPCDKIDIAEKYYVTYLE